MATITTLTALPSEIYAGDTLLFSVALANYKPSDGWTLEYSFRKKDGSVIDITSAAGDSDDHLFDVDSDTTGVWVDGDYSGVARVNDGTLYRTIAEARLTIKKEFKQQGADYDSRTPNKRCLDAIIAVMERRATSDVLNTVIAGQSVGRLSPEQLIQYRNYYAALVADEQALVDLANGKATGRNILARFN
jgi:hypothetical protein